MVLKRAVLLMAVAMVAWAVGHPAIAQTGDKYTARLGWVPIANQNDRANISGKGSVTATLAGTRLTLSGTFEGLPAPATVARLHRGIAKGARGPVVSDLTVTKAATGNAGTLAGTVTLTPLDVDNLKAGKLYVQLHCEKGLPKEDGSTLWGWFLR
jgi:hypothetical protein